MRRKDLLQKFHVVGPADDDLRVVIAPVAQKRFQRSPAKSSHHLDFAGKVGVHTIPCFIRDREGVERYEASLFEQAANERMRSWKSRAKPQVWNAIIQKQHGT